MRTLLPSLLLFTVLASAPVPRAAMRCRALQADSQGKSGQQMGGGQDYTVLERVRFMDEQGLKRRRSLQRAAAQRLEDDGRGGLKGWMPAGAR
ncbi:MAG: hypothetical protein LC114_20715 [Bryobacterales bacterium]|nr:hypothetical protein [Bryobacterales bacterium]